MDLSLKTGIKTLADLVNCQYIFFFFLYFWQLQIITNSSLFIWEAYSLLIHLRFACNFCKSLSIVHKLIFFFSIGSSDAKVCLKLIFQLGVATSMLGVREKKSVLASMLQHWCDAAVVPPWL